VQDAAKPLIRVPALGAGEWESQRAALFNTVLEIAGPPPAPKAVEPPVAALVCGLVILSDWLVSQEEFLLGRLRCLPQAGAHEELRRHYESALEAAPALLTESGLVPVRLKEGTFAEEFPLSASDLQQSIAQGLPALLNGPGLLLVMAPTGEGKTEAALHAARLMGQAAGAPGMFVALPTMATADQMYRRVFEYADRRVGGAAPLTLLHSMAWLNPAYGLDTSGEDRAHILTGDADHGMSRLVAAEWLRTRKRGLLAPLAVGTIDQALAAVLCARHNVLRLLGLAGKVFIVDEAHSYDAYMQALLGRLLRWLGALGAPVVLLSATLPIDVAGRLVRAYRQGARLKDPPATPLPVNYPGWIYADTRTGAITGTPVAARRWTLTVTAHPVSLDSEGRADRSHALRQLLAPLAAKGGCAVVVCTTVAEAQATYRDLLVWRAEIDDRGDLDVDLSLLHARFPARQREEITQKVVTAFGKDGTDRPRAAVLVATQVVEQSLDLDFDLVISDLGPVSLLLQRAGRGWRHPGRPADTRGAFTRPELAVLVPTSVNGELRLPRAWTAVYNEAQLLSAHDLLTADAPRPVQVPDDVQNLVDKAEAQPVDEDRLVKFLGRIAEEDVHTQMAKMVAIPSPKLLGDLHALTSTDFDDELIATRLGADAVRVLCCYVDSSGQRWLDPQLSRELPASPSQHAGRWSRDQVKVLLAETIPVRAGTWSREPGADTQAPASWQKNPWLRNLILLPHPVGDDGTVLPAQIGDQEFLLDQELGLLAQRVR